MKITDIANYLFCIYFVPIAELVALSLSDIIWISYLHFTVNSQEIQKLDTFYIIIFAFYFNERLGLQPTDLSWRASLSFLSLSYFIC